MVQAMSGEQSKGQGDREAGFYDEALVREAMRAGAGAELGDDVGELRRRLREVLVRCPDDVKLLLRGTDVLSRVASAEYRMSPRGRDALAANVKAVLDSLGGQLLPGPSGFQPRPTHDVR